MSQPPNPPMSGPTPSSPQPSWQSSAQPHVQPDTPAWAGPPPSWPPAVAPPAGPGAAGGPIAGAQATAAAQRNGTLLLALAAVVGLLVGMIGSGLAVTVLFASSAEDIGREMADRVGPAVERGIVDGTEQAMRDAMDEAMGVFPEDMGGYLGGPVPASEQFPPVPPEDLGPDPVLDDYAQQCFEGALQACDDLLYESAPMSEYETYGATCGGRVKEYTVVSCTDLE